MYEEPRCRSNPGGLLCDDKGVGKTLQVKKKKTNINEHKQYEKTKKLDDWFNSEKSAYIANNFSIKQIKQNRIEKHTCCCCFFKRHE